MKYQILIKNANVYYGKGQLETNVTLGISDGVIVYSKKNVSADEMDALEKSSETIINATGKLVSPGFLDTHMHIDINYTFDYTLEVPSLIGGAKMFPSYMNRHLFYTEEEILSDINYRSALTIENGLKNGTTGMKTNVTYMAQWGALALDSMIQLKEAYKGMLDLYIIQVFSNQIPDPGWPKALEYFHEMAAQGKIDFVASYPHKFPNGPEIIDDMFAIAKKYNLPIDMHCDESDVPNMDCFSYTLEKIAETGMEGKVTFGHITALSSKAMNEEEAQRLVHRAAEVKANITSLTTCNMYLMNMNRRGPTRVRELLDAGVNVSLASDDVREVLRPYGNVDLLEEALLTAKVHRMGSTVDLRRVFDMITYNPAINTCLENYGVKEGNTADLVILDAPTPEDAILDQCAKKFVIKDGNIVAQDGKLLHSLLDGFAKEFPKCV